VGADVLTGGAVPCAYVARYVADAFAVMLWLCAPPSDQEEKTYCVPFKVCGVVALIVFVEPMMTVWTKGVIRLIPFTTS
jgi:hypothetical protein